MPKDYTYSLNTLETAQDDLYIYSWNENNKVWATRNASRSGVFGNAIIRGNRNCPDEIIIPGKMIRKEENKEYPVEIIGMYSFYQCGYLSNTTSIFVPKEVKVIQIAGLGTIYKVQNLTFERGIQLEVIEPHGLGSIGAYLEAEREVNDLSESKTLVLPSSLRSVDANGIYFCNRFTRIVYCGTSDLGANYSILENNTDILTKVYVKPEYKSEHGKTIFGHEASEDLSDREFNEACDRLLPLRTPLPTNIGFACTNEGRRSPITLVFAFSLISHDQIAVTDLFYIRFFGGPWYRL